MCQPGLAKAPLKWDNGRVLFLYLYMAYSGSDD